MPVGGDDTEVTLMQSSFGAADLLGSKGVLQETGGRKWGSSSRRRWAVKRQEGRRRPGTYLRGGGPPLLGLRWCDPACRAGAGGPWMDSGTESSRGRVGVGGLLAEPRARPPLRGTWVF